MSRLPDKLITAIDALRERVPFSFARSAGPGGQNVNKVNTRVTLLFDLAGTHLLGQREKGRIHRKLGTRITKAGQLRIVSMRHRTQLANRRAAVQRFYELIARALDEPKSRRPTKPSQRARQRRLEEKRKRGQQKRLRRLSTVDRQDG